MGKIWLMVLMWGIVWLPAPAIAAPPPSPAALSQAATPSPPEVLERLFQADAVEPDWFVPAFLNQVPVVQLQDVLDALKQSLGSLQVITPVADGYQLTFERGTVPARIQLNRQGQITVLFFGPPQAPVSLEEAAAAVQQFPGDASLLVRQGDEVLVALNADQPLAVGSAFKLVVLTALQAAIAQGRLQWDDVVYLQPEWQSLPSGLLQDWPPGSAVTLETLATLMISVSDNTATDALINVVGRGAIAALSPRNQPFLTTREFFALKNPANADQLAAFRAAAPAARQQVLDTLGTAPLPDVSLFAGDPIALDVEWYLTAQELCDLMDQVRDLPLMQVNPGVAQPQQWATVAFKGGSEPGVLNLTTSLTSREGETYCVTTTWNDPDQALEELVLTQLHNGVIADLATR